MYNDVFSKSINVFTSSWSARELVRNLTKVERDDWNGTSPLTDSSYDLDPNRDFDTGNPYPFGLDPVRRGSEKYVKFTYSFAYCPGLADGIKQNCYA